MALKLGCRPRAYSPRIPHYSALLAGRKLPPIPASVDYSKGMGSDLGVMLNATLSDCTSAAVYHALQVWSYNAQGKMETEPDSNVELLYERTCGYVPGDSSSDQGGIEQEVLAYLLTTGAPVGPGGTAVHKIAAFVEIDPRHLQDVKRAIWEAGLVYLGMNVPGYLMDSLTDPGSVWDVRSSADQSSDGGHAVFACGYLPNGNLRVGSWGSWYEMTPAFWAENVDECYLLVDPLWVKTTGMTPAGMTLPALEQQAQAIREAA